MVAIYGGQNKPAYCRRTVKVVLSAVHQLQQRRPRFSIKQCRACRWLCWLTDEPRGVCLSPRTSEKFRRSTNVCYPNAGLSPIDSIHANGRLLGTDGLDDFVPVAWTAAEPTDGRRNWTHRRHHRCVTASQIIRGDSICRAFANRFVNSYAQQIGFVTSENVHIRRRLFNCRRLRMRRKIVKVIVRKTPAYLDCACITSACHMPNHTIFYSPVSARRDEVRAARHWSYARRKYDRFTAVFQFACGIDHSNEWAR